MVTTTGSLDPILPMPGVTEDLRLIYFKMHQNEFHDLVTFKPVPGKKILEGKSKAICRKSFKGLWTDAKDVKGPKVLARHLVSGIKMSPSRRQTSFHVTPIHADHLPGFTNCRHLLSCLCMAFLILANFMRKNVPN